MIASGPRRGSGNAARPNRKRANPPRRRLLVNLGKQWLILFLTRCDITAILILKRLGFSQPPDDLCGRLGRRTGFFGGLCLDLFSAGPLGLNTLTLTLVALLVSFLPQWFNLNQVTLTVIATAGGTLIFYYTQALMLQMVGISVSTVALQYAGRVALLHGIIAFPLLLPLRWIEWVTNPRPVQLPDL